MRYISDDNKVFNTLEECQAHEKSLKEDAVEKKKKEEYEVLKKRYSSIVDLIDKWEDDYYGFLNKYDMVPPAVHSHPAPEKKDYNCKGDCKSDCKNANKTSSKSTQKYVMDFSDILDFLESYFN